MKNSNLKIDINSRKSRVLLIYDFFDPATLAGGPIVSCVNMISYLNKDYDFYVYTSNHDLDGSTLNVEFDQWIDYHGIANVIYGDSLWSMNGYRKVLAKVKPDIIYINGIYSFYSVIVPLLISRLLRKSVNVVLAPRGMLQRNALNEKKYKKKIYLPVFFRLIKNSKIRWHVTGQDEEDDLRHFINNKECQGIVNVGNIPVTNMRFLHKTKNENTLVLLTVALISPMKNILHVLKALQQFDRSVVYHIYGNINDNAYWEKCLLEMKSLPKNIKVEYFGVANRADIPLIMESHDYYIQPSKCENFGHSIYEALISGLPVITSHTTPWATQDNQAGWNVDGNSVEDISNALLSALNQNTVEYEQMARNAHKLAEDYLLCSDLKQGYANLFAVTE